MQAYQGLQGPLAQMLQGYMQNPFGNPFFQTQQQMGTRQAQNLGQTQMNNITGNLTASGLGGSGSTSPFAMEMLQNQGRANSGLQAQLGFQNPVQNALGMQQFAGGLANSYRPLQTGQNTTQSTGGLGTWLPQVAGMGLSALMGIPGLGGGGINPMESNVGGIGASNAIGSMPFGNFNPGLPSMGGYGGFAGAGGGGMGSAPGMSTLGGMFPPPPAP